MWRSDLLEERGLVVSEAMRKALECAGIDNIQYIPAQVQLEHHEEVFSDFWVANVIGRVACVDPEESTFEPSATNELGDLRGFRVDPSQARALSLFRLAEDPRVIIVSDRVRRALEAADLEGLLFQDTRTYDGYAATTGAAGEQRTED